MIAMFIWTAGDLVSALLFSMLVVWFLGSLFWCFVKASWEYITEKFSRPSTTKDKE